MYDIENALRRRALAERLEGLSRAGHVDHPEEAASAVPPAAPAAEPGGDAYPEAYPTGYANGYTDGYPNGYTNGYGNGHANGDGTEPGQRNGSRSVEPPAPAWDVAETPRHRTAVPAESRRAEPTFPQTTRSAGAAEPAAGPSFPPSPYMTPAHHPAPAAYPPQPLPEP